MAGPFDFSRLLGSGAARGAAGQLSGIGRKYDSLEQQALGQGAPAQAAPAAPDVAPDAGPGTDPATGISFSTYPSAADRLRAQAKLVEMLRNRQ